MELQTEAPGSTRIYFSSDGYHKESNSIATNTITSENFEKYSVNIPFSKISNIRIDPISSHGNFRIKSVSLAFLWQKEILTGQSLIPQLNNINHTTIENNTNNSYLEATASSEDPYFEIKPSEFIENITKSPIRILFSLFLSIVTFFLGVLFFRGLEAGIINQRTAYYANIIILILILIIPPDGLSYIKTFIGIILLYVIPGYLILNVLKIIKKQRYIHSKFILSFVVGFSIWFISLYISSEFRLPISSLFIYIITALFFLWFVVLAYKKFPKKNLFDQIKISDTDLIMIILFNILLFVYLTPLKGLLVAPLHDPAGISVYAKKLIDYNYILRDIPLNYSFYPPAAYPLISLISDVMKIEASKTAMIITNVMNVFTGFAFSIFVSKIFKGKYLPVFSILVASFLSIYPASLYYLAGKNSQIIAYIFLFISLFFFYEAIGNRTKYKILFGLTLIASVLMHYNNLLPTLIFCIALYVYKWLKLKDKSIKNIIKDLLIWLLVGAGVLLILYLQLNVIRNVQYSEANILITEKKSFSFIGLKEFYNWIALFPRHFPSKSGLLILYLAISSYGFMTIKFVYDLIKRKFFNKEILFIFVVLLGFYLSLYIDLSVIKWYSPFNKFLILMIPITFTINYFFSNDFSIRFFSKGKKVFQQLRLNYFILFAFIIIAPMNMINLYNNYSSTRFCSLVGEPDIEVFEWINKNMPSGTRFLPLSISDITPIRQTYIQDSALYMKAFTDSYELFTFVYGGELTNEPELRKSYLALIEDPTDPIMRDDFISSGVNYIFSGSQKPWGCGDVPCDLFDNYPDYYEMIYNEDGVKIYKIKSDEIQ